MREDLMPPIAHHKNSPLEYTLYSFVALLCTCFTALLSSIKWGPQMMLPYSKIGQIKDSYHVL